jgi:hypothetical protein
MLTKKSLDRRRYPGAFKQLELQKAMHQQRGFVPRATIADTNGWQDTFAIPGLGLARITNTVAANGIGTIVGGYIVMNLGLFVQDNVSKDIVASGASNDFNGTFLDVSTDPSESTDMDVTAYLHYSYTPGASGSIDASPDTPPSGVVKRVAQAGATADPTITAPVRTTTAPSNPNAINIGLGRPWADQGGNHPYDYVWNEHVQDHPIGRIPFVGGVTFDQAIRTPMTPRSGLVLRIYVADIPGGGGTRLDAQDLTNVYSRFTIDPTNPYRLTWNLPPGCSSDPGYPITFGNVTWSSDIEAYFYCGITVVLEDGSLGFAAVQSQTSPDEDALDGILEIMPIDFIWHCLGGGAMVAMADGPLKPIEYVLAGDQVISNSNDECSTVVWTNKGAHKGSVMRITTDKGNALTTSHNHVFITSKGAVPAAELRVGDALQTLEGETSVIAIDHQPSYDGIMYNIATRDYQHPAEHDGDIATFVANGLLVGDTNAQKALQHLRRNNIAWVKQHTPSYLHTDVESYFEDKLSRK